MPSPAEISLMQSIRAQFGANIEEAVSRSSIPPEFIAALIGNESGGKPNARRYEKTVLVQLWDVLQGRVPAFGSIGKMDLIDFITDGQEYPSSIHGQSGYVNLAGVLGRLDAAASSWGLTQIMGYEAIALDIPLFQLQTVDGGLSATMKMLKQFMDRYKISFSGSVLSASSAETLFDCWNAGRPHAQTADPAYIPNGIARAVLYRDLLEEPPKAISA